MPPQGVGAFYKGFIPNFGRLGSWNVIMFLTLEQVTSSCALGVLSSGFMTSCLRSSLPYPAALLARGKTASCAPRFLLLACRCKSSSRRSARK